MMDDSYGMDINQAMALSRQYRDPLSDTLDHKEALAAFKEKRKPVFKGE